MPDANAAGSRPDYESGIARARPMAADVAAEGGQPAALATVLIDRLRESGAGYSIEALALRGAMALIAEEQSATRATFKVEAMAARPPRSLSVGSTAAAALRSNSDRSLLAMWMVGGRPLGECRSHELRGEADRLERTARGMQGTARFYRTIAELVPADELVRQHVTDEQANAILADAQAA